MPDASTAAIQPFPGDDAMADGVDARVPRVEQAVLEPSRY